MHYNWLNTTEYPFTANYAHINGQLLHYIDEGKGETILFVHGTPSWSFEFRNVITRLKAGFRCVAIDHIGFGLSSKPERYDYSTQNHSKTLEQFVITQQLDDITLVVHDFGGPIGFNFAINRPEKIKNLIVLNSWLWSSKHDPDFIKLSKLLASQLLPFLYRYLNFSPRFILPNSFGKHKLPKQLLQQYTNPFANKSQRNGVLAFAKSLLNDQDWFEDLWNKREVLADKPVLLIWGMKDPVIKPNNLEKFITGFPLAKTIKLQTSGHFPHEEQPEEMAKAILNFLR